MVGNVASRSAGKSLLMIVAVLMLPLLVLGGLYARQAWQGITVLDREILGLKIAESIYGQLLNDNLDFDQEKLEKIEALETALGGRNKLDFKAHLHAESKSQQVEEDRAGHEQHDNHSDHANGLLPNTHNHKDAFSGYLTDVGDVSGLILDSDARSYHLVNAFIIEMPKAVDEFETLINVVHGFGKDGKTTTVNDAVIQQLIGRAYSDFENVREAVDSANRNGSFMSKDVYNAYKSDLDLMSNIFRNLEMKFGQLTFVNGGISQADRQSLDQILAEFRNAALRVGNKGMTLLGELIGGRRSILVWEAVVSGILGIACALLGLILSTLLFRRTLVQLDKVTDLHDSAEFARRETDRINGEMALLNRDLSDKVQKLAEAQNEIVRKGRMEQLGQLTATIAHELRNPLGAVRTSTFLITRKTAGKDIGIEAQLERINSGITRCDNIITQLLDYSRTSKISPKLDDLDEWLAKLVSNEAVKFPPILIVECSLGLGGMHVPFDAARLERAIFNLMNNAVEAMFGGPQEAAPKQSANPLLQISTMRVGGHAVIRVKDNGPGIAAENLQRIREPLFTTKNFGTGLGIPAIEQIANQHNGYLSIESRFGEGACFELSLPLHQPGQELSKAS